ncbi:alpha-hydroxy acid oxidase [Brasilonema sp. UFV-L1]|uniref:alpha-hydroxy acid oxidase n=1 Tax=Brasilonema sp. UFV-L1 TaxID=2234130 RepID=UPI00145DF9B8|nr:alpha-hydroxy acid oxidase [Brasilonema sp. UFV-L1]NMG10926.1 alpha-hydroxy-acid oxidizing protein [Brasilonema sp. UFV-L1]
MEKLKSLKPLNLFEYEQLAPKYLSQMALDYYASGAWDEVTLQDNRAAFARFKLRPRVLVDVSQRNLATAVLNQPLQIPMLIAPMAFQCLANPLGEVATAAAAASAGVGMVLSTLSTKTIEEVSAVRHDTNLYAPQWFQLYIHKDRGLTRALVERAYATGYKALCITVDAPILGRRERDKRNEFTLPPGMELANFINLSGLNIPHEEGESGLFTYVAQQLNPAVTWDDLEWFQSLCPLPLVLKGILRGDDAARAVECGAKAIVVSNHGGRQLDGAIASVDALAEVVDAVGDRAEVLLDGGIRRGTDILKALALGAKAVLVGRPVLWGLAVAGQAGVAHVIDILRDELDVAMALSGCSSLEHLDSSLLFCEKHRFA